MIARQQQGEIILEMKKMMLKLLLEYASPSALCPSAFPATFISRKLFTRWGWGGGGGKSTSKVVLNFGYVVKVTALEEELWLSKAVRKLFKYPKIASIRSA